MPMSRVADVSERQRLVDLAATEALGARIAQEIAERPGGLICLRGPLGAGKTSFARGLLRALDVTGTVRSPTFTLMEVYETPRASILHLDLYRLSERDDLYQLGVDEYPMDAWWWLVEWPERAEGRLPPAWLDISFAYARPGRCATLVYHRGAAAHATR